MMIRIKTTGGATPNTTQWTKHGRRNVMHHAHTADANLSFDKYLSQSGVKYTHLGHFQANFFGNYKYDTTFYKYDTSYRYSYDNFAAESKRCGRDSIHHVPHPWGNGQPEWRRGVIHHVPKS